MLKYIIRDLTSMLHFAPYGILAGIVVLLLCVLMNAWRTIRRREKVPVPATVCFYMYVVIILVITFFSRESGSGKGLDLKLFSTWGINDRNNAYAIENILLFIPFGFVCPWHMKKVRSFLKCSGMGFLTSLAIECMQLVTYRGVFQIDDILTNLIGSMIGFIFFRCVFPYTKEEC